MPIFKTDKSFLDSSFNISLLWYCAMFGISLIDARSLLAPVSSLLIAVKSLSMNILWGSIEDPLYDISSINDD